MRMCADGWCVLVMLYPPLRVRVQKMGERTLSALAAVLGSVGRELRGEEAAPAPPQPTLPPPPSDTDDDDMLYDALELD